MPGVSPTRFAEFARVLAQAAAAHQLIVPGFRCPPRVPGAVRTMRRRPDGSAVVSVAIRGRTNQAVIDDLIEGVLVVNQLRGRAADGWRVALRHELATAALVTAA
jgi:hypothetical protein